MILAVMQPYFLPHPGYFQLLAAADRFVVFDDVAFITRGWINRNRILLNGREHRFTIPLQRASQNRLIREIELVADRPWRDDLLKTFRQAYRRASHFEEFFPVLRAIVHCEERNLAAYLLHSLRRISDYVGLRAEIIPTSSVYQNAELKGEERILDICRQEEAETYLNAIGGTELYTARKFAERGIELRFVKPFSLGDNEAERVSETFSIVHALMHVPREHLKEVLSSAIPSP